MNVFIYNYDNILKVIRIKKLNIADIKKVIDLSIQIFKPNEAGKIRHHNPKVWEKYLKEDGLLLGAFINGQLVGYSFGYKASDEEYHWWMYGVSNEARGKGIGSKLISKQEQFVKKEGYKKITVNTYKHKWPIMYNLLKRRGFNILKEEKQDWGQGKHPLKSFFIKNL